MYPVSSNSLRLIFSYVTYLWQRGRDSGAISFKFLLGFPGGRLQLVRETSHCHTDKLQFLRPHHLPHHVQDGIAAQTGAGVEIDPLTVVLVTVQTGHLVSLTRERGLRFSVQVRDLHCHSENQPDSSHYHHSERAQYNSAIIVCVSPPSGWFGDGDTFVTER